MPDGVQRRGARLDRPGDLPLANAVTTAALPDEAEICGCNGICKGQITGAIQAGASTLDAVRQTTKASSSCGT
ncbi:MAG: (2Fe-2S)-binding protein, partial [Pseudomonadota bacterium]